jgi:predicted dehydrogenase
MLEINDPAFHAEYFEKAAALGKPVFVDKPLAGTPGDGWRIVETARRQDVRVMSCSSLRVAAELLDALRTVPAPGVMNACGPMGKAPVGDSLIWYGVHAFEMLERAMGRGARRVMACEREAGVVAVVDYPDGRQGVVESRPKGGFYGGRVQDGERVAPFTVNTGRIYHDQMIAVRDFFAGGEPAGSVEDAFDILATMAAARRSIETGRPADVETLG